MLRLRLLRRTDSLCTRVAPWALAEKGPEVRLNGFGSNRFRGDRLMCGGPAPLRLLGHEADRPYPAGELARRGHVRLVAVDPAREQRLPPLGQPPHALGGMPPGAPVRGLAPGEVLRPPRARQVVPRGLDQRLPQVLVAGLGDRAPAVALPAGVLGGRQADPRRERVLMFTKKWSE